jgi:hypothetical protein
MIFSSPLGSVDRLAGPVPGRRVQHPVQESLARSRVHVRLYRLQCRCPVRLLRQKFNPVLDCLHLLLHMVNTNPQMMWVLYLGDAEHRLEHVYFLPFKIFIMIYLFQVQPPTLLLGKVHDALFIIHECTGALHTPEP